LNSIAKGSVGLAATAFVFIALTGLGALAQWLEVPSYLRADLLHQVPLEMHALALGAILSGTAVVSATGFVMLWVMVCVPLGDEVLALLSRRSKK